MRSRFVAALHLALAAAGIDAQLYSGHRVRIRAATTAAIRGIPDSLIKTLGRCMAELGVHALRPHPQ